jgi:RHS repeat-associated protein
VATGEQINFVVNRGSSNNACDGTYFNPEITYLSSTYNASIDFAGMQGARNWYYLDSTGAQMNFDAANNRWQGGETWLLLYGFWGHPGQNADAVRQWRAPQSGNIRITGAVADGDPNCGDGVVVSIKKGSQVLWQQTIANGNTAGFSYDLTTTVATGDQISFVINKGSSNNWCDGTYFNPTISYTDGGTTANINWLVTDQLGTPGIIIDKTGWLANVKRHDYLPFGEELFAYTGGRTPGQGYTVSGNLPADGARQKFTSKERDNETGLDYFNARYYASMQGRFTSADPLLSSGTIYDPQTWNRYSYTLNNPLKYVDPFGLYEWDASLGGSATDDDLKKRKGGQKIIDRRN